MENNIQQGVTEEVKSLNEQAEDFFKERFDTVYWDNKFNRTAHRFDFYAMTDFAQQFAQQFKDQLSSLTTELEQKREEVERLNQQLKDSLLLYQNQVNTISELQSVKEDYAQARKELFDFVKKSSERQIEIDALKEDNLYLVVRHPSSLKF